MNTPSMQGVRVWLSGSIDNSVSAEDPKKVYRFVVSLAKETFRRGGQIIHGCEPTLQRALIDAANKYKQEAAQNAPMVNIISRYFLDEDEPRYKSSIASLNAVSLEPVIETRKGLGDANDIRENSLNTLRNTLVEQSNVIVAIGGKWWNVAQSKAGVPKEIEIARTNRLPLFLLGGLGGATKDYIKTHPELLSNCQNGLSKEQNLALSQLDNTKELSASICDQIARLPIQRRPANAGRPFRVLCLDGGGIRGAYTAAVLATWEKKLGRKVTDHFDLIAGTSTGGLLALGLGFGLSAEDLLDFYKNDGPEIFPTESESDRMWHAFRHWFTSKFDQSVLEEKLRSAFESAPEPPTSLNNSLCRLVVPSYNATIDRPVVFRTNHRPGEHAQTKNNDPVQVALATSAAPTYFDPVDIKNHVAKLSAIDGGVWANDPTLIAISEAVGHLGVPLHQIEMLSIGTTFVPSSAAKPMNLDKNIISKALEIPAGTLGKLFGSFFWKDRPIKGKIGWVANIAEFLMKTQSQTAEHVCKELLGDRLIRINDASDVKELDDVQAIDKLVGLGEHIAADFQSEVSTRFLNGVPVVPWKDDQNS